MKDMLIPAVVLCVITVGLIFTPRSRELSGEQHRQLRTIAGTAGNFWFREMAAGRVEITLKDQVDPEKFLQAIGSAKAEIEKITGRKVAAVNTGQIIFVLDHTPAEEQ